MPLQQQKTNSFSFREVLCALKIMFPKNILLYLAAGLILFAGSLLYLNRYHPPEYTVVTSLAVINKNNGKSTALDNLKVSDHYARFFQEIINHEPIVEKTREELGLTDVTAKELNKNIRSEKIDNTVIIEIYTTANTKNGAADLARVHIRNAVSYALDTLPINNVLTLINPDTAIESNYNLLYASLAGTLVFLFLSLFNLAVIFKRRLVCHWQELTMKYSIPVFGRVPTIHTK